MTRAQLRFAFICTAGALSAAMLAGCTGDGHARSDARANVFPDNYRTELVGYLHTYINDPTNIRDAAITEPAIRLVSSGPPDRGNDPLDKLARSLEGGRGSQERYIVCVRFNAKNGDGRYTGLKTGMAIFSGGRFERFSEQRQGPCDQGDYKPFPELETLNR
jgi:hypothetical protein